MTTKITVDAHAGWPVEVRKIDGSPDHPEVGEVTIVQAGSCADFYVWQGRSLIITEIVGAGGSCLDG